MHVWQDKFATHQLSVADAMYLLVHDDVVAEIESVRMLVTTGMSTAQLLEAEMTLEQLDREWIQSRVASVSRLSRSAHGFMTISDRLFTNVWRHGVAFRPCEQQQQRSPPQSPSIRPLSPVRSPPRSRGLASLLSGSKMHNKPRKIHTVNYKTNQFELRRLQSELEISHIIYNVRTQDVLNSRQWIQDNCTEEVVARNSPLFHQMRKQKAAATLMSLLLRRFHVVVAKWFMGWRTATMEDHCRQRITRFCACKGALKLLILSRQLLKQSLLNKWARWKHSLKIQRKLGRLAGIVTIQSWMRSCLAKKRALTYHIQRAATTIQAAWHGHVCRKLLTRRRRFVAYRDATLSIERAYRAYWSHRQFAIHMKLHRASCTITRSIRRYCVWRRLFRSWCERVARFHSAAALQLWLRKTLARIQFERGYRAQREAAARTLQQFFRYVRFVLHFSGRVQRQLAKKHAAAVRLQNAYRAKLARARFYALKDQLEAQRRQQILTLMWNNAYATTIQRCWRQRRAPRRRRHPTP